MHANFEGLDESEGAWIDDEDDWSWVPKPAGGVPPALPVAGAWRPGLLPGPLEKIYLIRLPEETGEPELLVKWKGLAHIHCQWVPRRELEAELSNKQRVLRFLKAQAERETGNGADNTWDLGDEGDEGGRGARTDEEPYNPDFEVVERIVCQAASEAVPPHSEDLPPRYLVKWRSLPYAACTWESCRTLLAEQQAIRLYHQREQAPPEHEKKMAASGGFRPLKTAFKKLTASPAFKAGHALRSYQLEGLNWLLFSWYNRRSVMLADEMGLGKTVQSVSTLHHIWKEEGIRGPFLVLAPLSTLAHWLREFEEWTEMNTILYHGSNESRELIREVEWHFAPNVVPPPKPGSEAPLLYKFHVLITSYEVIKQDLHVFKKIPWRYVVIDEAHRLKNKDSALAADLRTISMEHMHLLSGTPLQNNTTELWALLYFLDRQLFPSLDEFLAEFGTLTDSAQVDALNEKIRPYLLRRQKGDVEKSLVPLEETIIWVEMTLFQKRCYRAVLEGNREILLGGAQSAAMPSLINLQMELRKVCNHPYLIQGIEQRERELNGTDEVEGVPPSVAAGSSTTLALPSAGPRPSYLESLLKASGKCVLLDKLLPKLKAEGHRVLIFSQMVRVLDLLSDYLRERRYSHERLDGTVRGDLRQAAIDRFCKPGSDTFAFLLSTRAGGLGINLIAADTCIIFDSDWNPQNDVQAMARSHRIGQSKRVKVFRFVTKNTYESEMVERANRKLGLERAMNADRASDGLSVTASQQRGPPQDRAEVDAMLKRGAHNIFLSEEDDSQSRKFNEADIDEILAQSTKVSYDQNTGSGSVFSKAAFVSDEHDVDMDDPEFWTKILPELQAKDEALAEYYVKRKSKQVARLGMASEFEIEEHLEEGGVKRRGIKDKGSKDEEEARRQARRSLAHVWSKTERMNVERAMLSYGFGRWARIKEYAGGATKLRDDVEVARFGVAFVCLCVGVPIAGVGGGDKGDARLGIPAGGPPLGEQEIEGIAKARELLSQLGCDAPLLTKEQTHELEPYVSASAGGHEYAERVHKLGATFMARLIILKRLADAVERERTPLLTFRAPTVPGGVGREDTVPWSTRDDAMLLLGVYKHGYRAYFEIADDPELHFGCRLGGRRPLPPLLPPAEAPVVPPGVGGFREASPASAAALGAGYDAPEPPPDWFRGYDVLDVLPVPAPSGKKLPPAPAGSVGPTFLSEAVFKARMNALLNAVSDLERRRAEHALLVAHWEEEDAAAVNEAADGGSTAPAQSSKGGRRPSKAPRLGDTSSSTTAAVTMTASSRAPKMAPAPAPAPARDPVAQALEQFLGPQFAAAYNEDGQLHTHGFLGWESDFNVHRPYDWRLLARFEREDAAEQPLELREQSTRRLGVAADGSNGAFMGAVKLE
jgi:chromodomain-helicase-DNA-binding protein 7